MNLAPILTLIAAALVLAVGTTAVRRAARTRRGRAAVAEPFWELRQPATVPPPRRPARHSANDRPDCTVDRILNPSLYSTRELKREQVDRALGQLEQITAEQRAAVIDATTRLRTAQEGPN